MCVASTLDCLGASCRLDTDSPRSWATIPNHSWSVVDNSHPYKRLHLRLLLIIIVSKLTQSHVWQNCLTFQQGPESQLKDFQNEGKDPSRSEATSQKPIQYPSLFHLPQDEVRSWLVSGRESSVNILYIYLLADWKAATIYGPSFPNRGSSGGCQRCLQATWLASLHSWGGWGKDWVQDINCWLPCL